MEPLNGDDGNSQENQDEFISSAESELNPCKPHPPLSESTKAQLAPDYAYMRLLIEESVDDPSNQWTPAVKDDFHCVYSRHDGENPVVLVKVYATLKDLELEKLFQLIVDCEARKDWDKILKEFTVYEKFDDYSDLIYCVVKTPIGFSNRDYVQYRHFINSKRNPELVKKYGLFVKENEYYAMCLKSVDLPEIPPVKGLVRAHTIITGYLIEQDGPDLNFTMVLQTDVKGYIPKSIFNRASTRVPGMWLKNLLEGYDQRRHEE